MEALYQYQSSLLRTVSNKFIRDIYSKIDWNDRFVAVKGLRGIGKTTMLLQHLKYTLSNQTENLYVTLDHPYFYDNSLYDLAVEFSGKGGKILLVDEVHKLKNWSKQIKIIYDGLPDLQVIMTSSSALDLYRGDADLSRRVVTHRLGGLSFREFLQYGHNIDFQRFTVEELTKNHVEIVETILQKTYPLAYFSTYLQRGYFPFGKSLTSESLNVRLLNVLEIVLSEDMAYVNEYAANDIYKLKKLLAVIAETVPFTINVTAIADKLGIGRNKLKEYMHALETSGILSFLNREGKGVSVLQKPDKIYLENTNLSYALKNKPDVGTLRETFVLNQLKNAGFDPRLPNDGDVQVVSNNITYTFEIGGKSKSAKQISGVENSFVLADDLEVGFGNKIPLYLFGFLY